MTLQGVGKLALLRNLRGENSQELSGLKTSDLGSTSKPYIACGVHSFEKYVLSTWESSHSFGVSEQKKSKKIEQTSKKIYVKYVK